MSPHPPREGRKAPPRRVLLAAAVITAITLITSASASAGPVDVERLLSAYIQIDTTTAAGEHRAAGLLADELHRHGVTTRLLVGPENRPSLYAEVGPEGTPAVLLLHHLDVVPAQARDWLYEPFTGAIHRGRVAGVDSAPEIWGRGAIDSKGLGVAHLAALVAMAEESEGGDELPARIAFLATADEENGGVEGLGRLIERHPALFADVAVAVTEGGVNRVLGAFDDRLLWWGIEFQQKRPLWLEVTFDGQAGHGAKLDLHSAPKKLARAIAAVADRPRVYRADPAVETYLGGVEKALGAPRGPSLAAIHRAIEDGTVEGLLQRGQHQLFLDTVQVTRLRAGESVNVVPATATATLDARLLPGTDQQAFQSELVKVMRQAADATPKVRVLLETPAIAASPVEGRWWRALARGLGAVTAADEAAERGEQGATPLVPLFISGATDARYLRQLGIPTYGVSPFLYPPEVRRGIHGVDERVPVKEFVAGVARMEEVVRVLVAEAAEGDE